MEATAREKKPNDANDVVMTSIGTYNSGAFSSDSPAIQSLQWHQFLVVNLYG